MQYPYDVKILRRVPPPPQRKILYEPLTAVPYAKSYTYMYIVHVKYCTVCILIGTDEW